MLVILYFIIAGKDTTTALRKTFGLVKLQGSLVQQTTMIHMLLHKKNKKHKPTNNNREHYDRWS